MGFLSPMLWLSLSTAFFASELVQCAKAANVTETPGLAKRCGSGNTGSDDTDANPGTVMSGFSTPSFSHAVSDAWGGDKSKRSFNDYADYLADIGDENPNGPKYRLTGVRGRCHNRVDNLQFRYSRKHGTKDQDVFGNAIGGGGGELNPHWSPKTRSQPFVDLASADGKEYVDSIRVNVCETEKSDRICWISISTNKRSNVFECGVNTDRGTVKHAGINIIKPNSARLYTVMGYYGHAIDKIQFVWVPANLW